MIRNLASGCDIPYSVHGCALHSYFWQQGIDHLLMHAALFQQGILFGRYYNVMCINYTKIDTVVPQLWLDLDLLLLWSFPLGFRFEFLPPMNARVHHLGIFDTGVELPIWSPLQGCIDSPWISSVELDIIFALILNYFLLQLFKRSECSIYSDATVVRFFGSHFCGLLRTYVQYWLRHDMMYARASASTYAIVLYVRTYVSTYSTSRDHPDE